MSRRHPDKTLVGRKIVSVDLREFQCEGDHRTACDPRIVFDDGSTLTFLVQETNDGIYGVELLHFNRSRRKR